MPDDRNEDFPFASPSAAARAANEVFDTDGPEAADALLIEALDVWPNTPALLSKRLQLCLKARRIEAAREIALSWRNWNAPDARLLSMAARTLQRTKETRELLALFQAHRAELIEVEAAIVALMDYTMAQGAHQEAVSLGLAHMKAVGEIAGTINGRLGQAYSELGNLEDGNEHLLLAIDKGYEAPQVLACLARNLLAQGTPGLAIPYLENALEQAPDLANARIDLARAHKLKGNPQEALAELRVLPETLFDKKPNFRRLKVAVLAQTGQVVEAETEFKKLQTLQAARVQGRLADQLDGLWEKPHHLSEELLRWGAQVAGEPEGTHLDPEWRRRAHWGYEADRLLLDWVESREDLIEEVMLLLDDLEESEAYIKSVVQDRPSVFIAAHIGALFAAPVALELIDLSSVWLASTPNLPSLHYNDNLISTSDKTEAQVAKAAFGTLRSGRHLTMAIDGAVNPAAPRVEFEGKQVTWSAFAARVVYKFRSPCLTGVPIWRNGRLVWMVAEISQPNEGEKLDAYIERFKTEFFAHVKRIAASGPENLRLAGGIWRGVH